MCCCSFLARGLIVCHQTSRRPLWRPRWRSHLRQSSLLLSRLLAAWVSSAQVRLSPRVCSLPSLTYRPPAGFDSSESIRETFKVVREKLNIPKGKPVPFGVGIIGWILDMTEGSDDPRIPTILEEMPEAIWFAFGDLGKYIKRVHEYDAKIGRAHV